MVGVLFLKPIIVIWATMNAIDDLAMLMRVARLGMMVVPGQGRNPGDMCEMCDDVMGDLLHPEVAGYRLWADAIEPHVARLLPKN